MILLKGRRILADIAVALSGGVDSSVAAFLLKEAGHRVHGLSLRMGAGPDQAWQAGAGVAKQLGISHQVVEAAPVFEQRVLGPVASLYSAGRTPNPCGLCNARVKFPLLVKAAQDLGCGQLATGHYARIARRDGKSFLGEGVDRQKSQAYFLARLAPDILPLLVFPLGELTKDRVREIAARAGLVAAQRPESQDVCFLPEGGWDEFIGRRGAIRPGSVEDDEGRVLGEHRGLHHFTVGQRRGLGLALGRPMYVTALDGERSVVTVGPKSSLATRGLAAEKALWYQRPDENEELTVRFRYSHPGVGCRLSGAGDGVKVDFCQEQGAVAPGQLAVFFKHETVRGSAWIVESYSSNYG